ncbi:MAG: glycosyltransferase family 2 protein [Bacteroidales bacterium]|nr:glycosyltransferase family 2 protein [Bacteroidales bacterium]
MADTKQDKLTVAILITARNRREKTLACLENCRQQFISLKTAGQFAFSIYLTDDASTDGTSEAVADRFPDVHIIKGDGNLFWNRGMHAAWTEAAKRDYDFYLWLNDDTVLLPGAIGVLLENSYYLKHNSIVVGTAVDSAGNYSYGGRTRSGKIVAPDPTIPVVCDIFNGNVVLVPKSVYKAVGMMDPFYSHSFGDFDYGVRADKAGFASLVAPGTLARCDRNPGLPKWRDGAYPIGERFRALKSPKGRPFKEQFVYDSRLKNVFWAAGHYVSIFLKTLFPKRTAAAVVAPQTTAPESEAQKWGPKVD